VRKPTLEATETVARNWAANRTQSDRRAVGGRLFLTGSRLIFEPNRFDAVAGGRPWSVPLTSVRTVGTELPDGKPFSGGLRTRLRLDLVEGKTELFVVNHVEDVAEVIRQSTGQSA